MKALALLPFFLFACSTVERAPLVERKLDPEYAAQAVALSVECAVQDTPHYYERICEECTRPRQKHPAFYGCYDWHSAVHGHWAMLHVIHQIPSFAGREKALAILDRHLTKKNMEGELRFFEKAQGFELPYGYGWYLRLVSEVRRSPLPQARKWLDSLAPLEQFMLGRWEKVLAKMAVPMREGAHMNTAYSLNHGWDYARAVGNTKLQELIRAKAMEFYGKDENCPLAYEPSAGDFVSPCFVEADLMRRVMEPKEFQAWFSRFLPRLSPQQLEPVVPLDLKDYILGHLIGLMFQKAASMEGVASALPSGDSRRALLEAAARKQAATGWKLMFDSGYGGTHWLASFAIFYYGGVGL